MQFPCRATTDLDALLSYLKDRHIKLTREQSGLNIEDRSRGVHDSALYLLTLLTYLLTYLRLKVRWKIVFQLVLQFIRFLQ